VAGLYRRLSVWIAVTDASCVVAALLLAYLVRFREFPAGWGYSGVMFVGPLLWLGIFQAHRLYSPQQLSAWEEFRRIIAASTIGVVLIVMASYWSMLELSRIWMGLTWVLSLVFVLLGRRAWRWYRARLRSEGRLCYRTLIVGTNEEAAKLGHSLSGGAWGFSPQGYVAVSPTFGSVNGLPVLGRVDELSVLIQAHSAECVYVASTAVDTEAMAEVMKVARRSGAELRVSANLPETLSPRLMVQSYGDVMALSLSPVRLTGAQLFVKRAFDLVVAGLGLVALLPVLGATAAAVKLTSRGPVLFRQERVTKGGRVFTMYKFRTMVAEADEILEESEADPTTPFFKLQEDPRVTRLGAWMRRWSLDEIPQLFNVIRGDLSLVGPRPLPTDQVAANMDLLEPRHEVSAGVTGWWQIQGRSDLAAEDSLRMDLFYIENWSLSLDLFIILKTIGAVMRGRGAL